MIELIDVLFFILGMCMYYAGRELWRWLKSRRNEADHE